MVSIKDVAELAGVSVATVSRTLSRPDKVAESTRERVMQAVEKSGYVTNVLASNFRRRRSHNIILLVPDIANPFFSTIIQEIEEQARHKGYQILLGDTRQNQQLEASYGNLALQRMADGLISLGMNIPFRHRANRKTVDPKWPPLVMGCEYKGSVNVPLVAIDNFRAAYDATRHVLDLGHRRVGFIGGPEDFSLSLDRLEGFRAAMAEAGCNVGADHVVSGNFSLTCGFEAAEKLLGLGHPPTAMICTSDELAMGAMNCAVSAGVSIPEDLSVVGFDDIEFAAYSNPPLTTVRQPMADIGRHLMHMILTLLEGGSLSEPRVVLPHQLIVRDSTGRAPGL